MFRVVVTCSTTKSLLFHWQSRSFSALPSLISTESFDAPHCGTIKVLKFDRPEARNAISRRLLADLKSEIDNLDLFPLNGLQPSGSDSNTSAVRALIITSAVDGVFCAGADLKERISFTLDE